MYVMRCMGSVRMLRCSSKQTRPFLIVDKVELRTWKHAYFEPWPSLEQSESSMQTEKGVGLTVWAWSRFCAANDVIGNCRETARNRTNDATLSIDEDFVSAILLVKPDTKKHNSWRIMNWCIHWRIQSRTIYFNKVGGTPRARQPFYCVGAVSSTAFRTIYYVKSCVCLSIAPQTHVEKRWFTFISVT